MSIEEAASLHCLHEFSESLHSEQERCIISEAIKVSSSINRQRNIVEVIAERTGLSMRLIAMTIRRATKYGCDNLGIHVIAETFGRE